MISNAREEADGTLRMEATYYDRAAWERFSLWLMSRRGRTAAPIDVRLRRHPRAG